MLLHRLSLHNFRSYEAREFAFSPQVSMIVGRNGVGKTNILEAIHVLMQGKSFRDSDEQLVRHDEAWWKIAGVVDEGEREVRYRLGEPSPKQLFVDGVSRGRFTYRHQLPIVLFEPDDLFMVHASPGARRRYLDALLLKVQPSYRQTLARYERALLQRNNLLKKRLPVTALRDAVFVWDIALSEYGSEIVRQRARLVQTLNDTVASRYSSIAHHTHTVTLVYDHTRSSESQLLVQQLAHSLDKDVLRGFTSVGPHRDDLDFELDGKPAKQTASRGEVRTLVLALKRIELDVIERETHHTPILLLDDVFSELDATRQRAITHDTRQQTIITSTTTAKTPDQSIIVTIG